MKIRGDSKLNIKKAKEIFSEKPSLAKPGKEIVKEGLKKSSSSNVIFNMEKSSAGQKKEKEMEKKAQINEVFRALNAKPSDSSFLAIENAYQSPSLIYTKKTAKPTSVNISCAESDWCTARGATSKNLRMSSTSPPSMNNSIAQSKSQVSSVLDHSRAKDMTHLSNSSHNYSGFMNNSRLSQVSTKTKNKNYIFKNLKSNLSPNNVANSSSNKIGNYNNVNLNNQTNLNILKSKSREKIAKHQNFLPSSYSILAKKLNSTKASTTSRHSQSSFEKKKNTLPSKQDAEKFEKSEKSVQQKLQSQFASTPVRNFEVFVNDSNKSSAFTNSSGNIKLKSDKITKESSTEEKSDFLEASEHHNFVRIVKNLSSSRFGTGSNVLTGKDSSLLHLQDSEMESIDGPEELHFIHVNLHRKQKKFVLRIEH